MTGARHDPRSTRRPTWELALASLVACASPGGEPERSRAVETAPSPEPSASPGPVVVDYGPCASTRSDAGPDARPRSDAGPDARSRSDAGPEARPRCVFAPERGFRVWVEPERVDELEVFVDGRRVPSPALDPVGDGSHGIEVRLGEAATELEVRLAGADERWRLPLQAQSCADCHHGADEGARDAAVGFYERMAAPATRPDWRRELPEVLTRLDATGLLEEQLGLVDATVFVLSREHQFEEAAAVLELAEPLGRRSPRLHAMLAYARGQLDWRRGRYGDALTALRAASQHAVRTDELDIGLAVLPMYAELLTELGYFQAASKWSQVGLEQVRERGDACELASTLRTTAWAQLRLRQHAWSSQDPTPLLEEALAIFGPEGACPRPDRTGGVRSSLALLQLQADQPSEALATVGRAERSRMTPGERVLASDVELQARLVLDHDAALLGRALEQLRRAVEDADTTDARWHLTLREGQVREARDDHAAAIEAYRAAEAHLDRLAQLATFGVGRSSVGTFHRESSERLVDVLRALGRIDEALCVARQAEARRIQAASLPPSLPEAERARLEQRASALAVAQAELEELMVQERDAPVEQLARARARVVRQQQRLEAETDAILRDAGRHARPPPCESLHAPGPGELLLGLFPRGEEWLLFAQDDRETTVHAVDLRELDLVAARARLGEILLRPVAAQLRRARRIRVHAVGQAQRIDVDRLPWEGEPLVARVPVAWAVDVATAPAAIPAADELAPRAVLLADPTGSLPEAEQEVADAHERLVAMGFQVEVIARDDARPHVVQERMAAATLLHYAGHADHDELLDPGWWPPYPGGTPSWPASLRLADGTQLAAPEILMRQGQVPRKVLLSACRTGVADASATGTSLAVAFLVAGADEVLATSAITADAEARAVVREVYEGLQQQERTRWSLVDALARAQARRLAAGEASGRHRVWVR